MESKRDRKGIMNVPASALLAFTVVGLGLFAWGYATSYTMVAASDFGGEVSSEIMQQETQIVIEHIQLDAGELRVWLFNIGKVPVEVTRVVVSRPDGSASVSEFGALETLDVQESRMLCVDCSFDGDLAVRVYAVACPLFNPEDPFENMHWGIMVESSFNG